MDQRKAWDSRFLIDEHTYPDGRTAHILLMAPGTARLYICSAARPLDLEGEY